MAGETGENGNEILTVEGKKPLRVALDDPPEWLARRTSRQRVGFECASGDWIEREYLAFPVTALIEAADFPADTTHVVLESSGGYRACVPVTATADAVIAVGEGPGKPRFLSPDVVGPRAIKNLASIRPRSLGANEDIEEYERLPIEGK
jgi:hypothetical protein